MVTRKRDEQNMGLEKEHVAEIRKKYDKKYTYISPKK